MKIRFECYKTKIYTCNVHIIMLKYMMQAKKGGFMKREINKLMRANNFVLIRSKKHNVWEKVGYGLRMSTSSTPSDRNALYSIKRDIRKINRTIGIEGINYG